MLIYLRNDIFDTPAQTIVNTVNLEGVMGKGLAAACKSRYPDMYLDYRKACELKKLKIGSLHLWRGSDHWILNFPTKTTWRQPSKIEYIADGLKKFVESYEQMGITSVSFPPLGCGNGQLSWDEVRPIMESYLKKLPIPVYIHDKHVPIGFIAEHAIPDINRRPPNFDTFLMDIRALLLASRGSFVTLKEETPFLASISPEGDIRIQRSSKTDRIPVAELEQAWDILQFGLLTADSYSGESRRRYKSYLFSILSQLPYITSAIAQHVRDKNTIPGHALYFLTSDDTDVYEIGKIEQGKLWG